MIKIEDYLFLLAVAGELRVGDTIFQLILFLLLTGFIMWMVSLFNKRNKDLNKAEVKTEKPRLKSLKFLRIILSVIVIFIAGYGLITKDYEYQSYMILFLSLLMLVIGLDEFQQGRKSNGWINIVVFLFALFVSLQGILLN